MGYPGSTLWACVALAALACRGESNDDASEREHSATSPARDSAPALRVLEVSIDALAAPRDGNPLIAGEQVRIGLRLRGGTPPLSITVQSVRLGTSRPEDATAPIDARATPNAQSSAVDMALATRTAQRAPSGVYQLRATVRDARGREATALSRDWRLIGDDAETIARPAQPPRVEVVDVAGRRRRSFVRGERVTLRALLPGERAATVELRDPDGQLLTRARQPLSATGALRFAMDVPRLARVGAHSVLVAGQDGARARGTLEVAGQPFAPASRLVLDHLAIYGGEDLRAPRGGLLDRGETVHIQARVGGGRRQVTAAVRLYALSGQLVDQAQLGHARIARPSPRARVYIQGTWQVPEAVTPGRYQLQLEATEEDHVSVRHREVLVQ